jgi:hypothetical protein
MQKAIEPSLSGMLVDAHVHRYALGLLRGDAQGAALCTESERAMRDAGVVDPLAYVRSFYPELLARP